MNGLDIIIQELRGAQADLQAENERRMHIDQPEQKQMCGIFRRFYNHQGELRWKFIGPYAYELDHTVVNRLGDSTFVTCRVKRAPRVGTYCKAPAHYMRAAA